jgi:hypothetical protein
VTRVSLTATWVRLPYGTPTFFKHLQDPTGYLAADVEFLNNVWVFSAGILIEINLLSLESQQFTDSRMLPHSQGGNMTTQTYSQRYTYDRYDNRFGERTQESLTLETVQ